MFRSIGRVVTLALFFGLARFCDADITFRAGTIGHFASVNEGAHILTTRDEFVQRLSAFDRSARVKTDQPVSEERFLEFVKANVIAWRDDEKRKIEAAVEHIRPGLDALPLSLPKAISVIKTTGAEEGGAFYTRDTAIVIPQGELTANGSALEKIICHELFHILSRENPQLREELYAMIGFKKCPEIEFPAKLKPRKITNPDAPRNDHCIRLRVAGGEALAVPVLFSNVEKYDPARGGEFFNYLQFKFLLMGRPDGSLAPSAGEQSNLFGPEEVSGFAEQVGKNTQYIIHPEEILADNFALLILGQQEVPSPEILQKMKKILTGK